VSVVSVSVFVCIVWECVCVCVGWCAVGGVCWVVCVCVCVWVCVSVCACVCVCVCVEEEESRVVEGSHRLIASSHRLTWTFSSWKKPMGSVECSSLK
jgi:hypothetical protein